MSAPFLTFTDAGPVAPTEAEIRAFLWDIFQTAFGGNLNQSDTTPQGQLVTSLAAQIGASNDQMLEYYNLIDPATSSGRMQDAIGRIYYLERLAPRATSVSATCRGAVGTVLQAGALAQASDGTIYQSMGDAVIGSDGTATVTFAAIEDGPIECPAGTLNAIYRVVVGWDSITNDADGIIGRDTETAHEFEARRTASVAGNAVGMLQSILAAVLNVEDVVSAYVTENATASSATIGGVSIAARSIYVAAQGGADADIAAAIWSKKSGGCGYVGNTTVTVYDMSEAYAAPYPSYSVTFQRPAALPIYVSVVLANNGQVPADAAEKIKTAIVSAFSGSDGGTAVGIGRAIYASRFYAPIAALGSWAQISSLTIGTSASPTGTSVSVNIDKYPTIDTANIVVTVA